MAGAWGSGGLLLIRSAVGLGRAEWQLGGRGMIGKPEAGSIQPVSALLLAHCDIPVLPSSVLLSEPARGVCL